MVNESPGLNNNDVIRLLIRRQIELNSLLEITQSINNNHSSKSLFSMYEFVLKVHLNIQKLALYIFEDNEWKRAASFGCSNNILNNEKQIGLDLKSLNYTKPYRFRLLYQNEFEVIIPVLHKSTPLAYVLATGFDDAEEDAQNNTKFIQTITNVIVVAIENKKLFRDQLSQEGLKKELELASKVQEMLFPPSLPANANIEISANYMPHQSVGGDYYDFFKLNEDEIFYCIADVAGKGISAAILMSNFQAYLRTLATVHSDLETLVGILNTKVVESTKGDRFITAFFAKYNTKTKKFSYVNAGHNPPIIFQNNKIDLLKTGCTILGVFEELPNISSGEFTLSPGCIIVNYTDGVIEMEEDLGYNQEKLMDFVLENANISSADFNKKLLSIMQDYKSQNMVNDDITLLTFKAL